MAFLCKGFFPFSSAFFLTWGERRKKGGREKKTSIKASPSRIFLPSLLPIKHGEEMLPLQDLSMLYIYLFFLYYYRREREQRTKFPAPVGKPGERKGKERARDPIIIFSDKIWIFDTNPPPPPPPPPSSLPPSPPRGAYFGGSGKDPAL